MPKLINEKELEDYVFENGIKDWDEWTEHSNTYRQINIPGYGIIDLINVCYEEPIKLHPIAAYARKGSDYFYNEIDVHESIRLSRPIVQIKIIEIKNNSLKYEDIGQISRYRKALIKLLNLEGSEIYEENWQQFCFNNLDKPKLAEMIDISSIIICSNIPTDNDLVYLIEHSRHWLEIYTYDISLEYGISFESYCSNRPSLDENLRTENIKAIFKKEFKNYKTYRKYLLAYIKNIKNQKQFREKYLI